MIKDIVSKSMEQILQAIAKDESMRKQDKHTSGNNRQQKNTDDIFDPRISGDNLKDVKKTVSDRETAKNEGGKHNKSHKDMGERGTGQKKRDKRK